MANPNENQMRQTRDALQAMADNLRKLKQQKDGQLSNEEDKAINDAIKKALNAASAANAAAIQDTVDNIQNCVNCIGDAKKGLDNALENLYKVKNILKIATSVAELASAVARGDVKTIIGAAGEVVAAVKA